MPNFKRVLSAFSIVLALAFAQSVSGKDSATNAQAGPHGGVVLSGSGQSVEVSLDPVQSKVNVYVIKSTKEFPKSIGLSLRDSKGKVKQLELQTILPDTNPVQYSTSLVGGSQSYMGFEIKIPFRNEPHLILKSK